MGYTTDFYGEFKLSKKLTPKQKEYLETFSGTRRMKRDVNKLMEIYQGKHGIPDPKGNTPEDIYGREGEYFAYDDGNCGRKHDASIIDYNTPPGQTGYDTTQDFSTRWDENQNRIKSGTCQPGFWCQWTPNDEGNILEWDGGEKFYNYVEWLKYYIEHFFKRWGIKLKGDVEWQGEDPTDKGKISVRNNNVKTYVGRVVYDEEK